MCSLVVFFSTGGTTKQLASYISEAAGADLFELRPVVPYTQADLRWLSPVSRCNKEKFFKKAVPFDGAIDGFDKYDTVFIGFPVWYGAEPNIIDTFVKSYDFTGKRIALFATSGGSDISRVPARLHPLVNAEIIGAMVFDSDSDKESLIQWTNVMMDMTHIDL